jgi:very-short-patch-repair endonuclease
MAAGSFALDVDHVVLSVLTGILTAMTADVPPQLSDLAAFQDGMITRAQILDLGLTKDIIASRLARRRWQLLYPGVYAAFSGQLPRNAVLWAAVLSAGPGAMLSHQTAAELWKLADAPSELIHVTVPSNRRVKRCSGMAVHLSRRASAAMHPSRNPPRTRLEETVIDLWASARTLDTAVGWVTSALGRRLTTQEKLREAMEARSRLPRRTQLAELLGPDETGIHSVLEYRYVRDVERPHGLAGAQRQVRARRHGRTEYRDLVYEAYSTAVELDGKVAHPGDARWRDIHRDNAASAVGITTLRYSWFDVTSTPCRVAAELAQVLAARGYTGARPCSTGCPVVRPSTPARPTRLLRPSLQNEARTLVSSQSPRRTRARSPRPQAARVQRRQPAGALTPAPQPGAPLARRQPELRHER